MNDKNFNEKEWDVFISHASEDKDDFVSGLVISLTKFNIKTWYDSDQLTIGDSLSKTIDIGLIKSRFGILVISINFLKKKWPEYEYRSLLAREINGKKVILPVWHNISIDDILEYSPYLADKYALNSSKMNSDRIAFEILKVTNPDAAKNYMRYRLFQEIKAKAKRKYIKRSDLHESEIRHETLPVNMIIRIKIFYNEVFTIISDKSFKETVDSFKRDLHPNDEIAIWEKILLAGQEYCKNHKKANKRKVFSYLLALSSGIDLSDQIKNIEISELNKIWIIVNKNGFYNETI